MLRFPSVLAQCYPELALNHQCLIPRSISDKRVEGRGSASFGLQKTLKNLNLQQERQLTWHCYTDVPLDILLAMEPTSKAKNRTMKEHAHTELPGRVQHCGQAMPDGTDSPMWRALSTQVLAALSPMRAMSAMYPLAPPSRNAGGASSPGICCSLWD